MKTKAAENVSDAQKQKKRARGRRNLLGTYTDVQASSGGWSNEEIERGREQDEERE